MESYEKLGAFYLGRAYDLDAHQTAAEPLLYDSRDLLTHAVCVGMTGSGKTGLCVSLLEEAAVDGIDQASDPDVAPVRRHRPRRAQTALALTAPGTAEVTVAVRCR